MSQTCISPAFLNKFTCIGDKCEDTCCKGWNMQLGNVMRQHYADKAPELLDAVAGDKDNYIMRRDPQSDYCVKFDSGLCGILKQYDDNFLGDACYFYPRATRALGETITMTAALSCPEVARLALFDQDAFTENTLEIPRLPTSLGDYLPEGLSNAQALATHRAFLQKALDTSVTPERALSQIFAASESLQNISIASWADAAPFYLQNADSNLGICEASSTDSLYLLQSLCGLIVAAKKVGNGRLMQVVSDIEQALHVQIRLDNLAIAPLPDSNYAISQVIADWQNGLQDTYRPILRNYLAAQISLALFPFAGFGNTLCERIAIIGIRMATIKLAIMCACNLNKKAIYDQDVVRIISSLSRFLDHLSDPEFSLKIYGETGWLGKNRLRGVLGDL